MLDVGDQSCALLLRGERGERLSLFPGLLHHVEIQFQGSLRVQAEQVTLTAQMAVRGR